MTQDQFRANPELTARFRELVNDPVMQQAIAIWMDGKRPEDPILTADAIVSVRILNQMVGADASIAAFLKFADPLVPDIEIPKEDWGVEETEKPETT